MRSVDGRPWPGTSEAGEADGVDGERGAVRVCVGWRGVPGRLRTNKGANALSCWPPTAGTSEAGEADGVDGERGVERVILSRGQPTTAGVNSDGVGMEVVVVW